MFDLGCVEERGGHLAVVDGYLVLVSRENICWYRISESARGCVSGWVRGGASSGGEEDRENESH